MEGILTKIKQYFKKFNTLKISVFLFIISITILPESSGRWGQTALHIFIICMIISAVLFVSSFVYAIIKAYNEKK